eukprot:4592660-Amphidinium_carterae.1
MLSKKRVPSKGLADPSKILKAEIKDLYGDGTIDARRCQRLMASAAECGVDECDFKSFTTRGSARSRDVQRALLKDSNWPELFTCSVP